MNSEKLDRLLDSIDNSNNMWLGPSDKSIIKDLVVDFINENKTAINGNGDKLSKGDIYSLDISAIYDILRVCDNRIYWFLNNNREIMFVFIEKGLSEQSERWCVGNIMSKRTIDLINTFKKAIDKGNIGDINIEARCYFCQRDICNIKLSDLFNDNGGYSIFNNSERDNYFIACDSCEDAQRAACYECGCKIYDVDNEFEGNVYCNNCFHNRFARCNECGRVARQDDLMRCDDDENYYCDSCYPTYSINDYSYKPKPTFFGNSKDHLFFGFELEIECEDNDRNDIADELISRFNDDNLFYLKSDGSLNNGFEIVSHPLSFDYLISIKGELETMFKWLVDNGATGHDNDTCGLHFHLSRKAFNDDTLENFIYLTEKHQNEIKLFSRRRDYHWCEFLLSENERRDKKKASIINNVKHKDLFNSRYRAINLQNNNTIEIRYNRSTLNINAFYASLQLLYNQYLISKNNKKTIESFSFNKIIKKGGFDELIKYWEMRTNKRQGGER